MAVGVAGQRGWGGWPRGLPGRAGSSGVDGRGCGHELFAEAGGDDLAGLLLGYGGDVGRVGPHVGDQAGRAFVPMSMPS